MKQKQIMVALKYLNSKKKYIPDDKESIYDPKCLIPKEGDKNN